MHIINDFTSRTALDSALAENVANILENAITKNGKASIAVSGGSTPKGFFSTLSNKNIAWEKVTITLADERWVDMESDASNTRLVHENLLQNKASKATFFHLKQGEVLSESTLARLNDEAKGIVSPLDVLILGMGEDGHTASLFPCSDEIKAALDPSNPDILMKVIPKTAPHSRITFTFSSLINSENIILHLSGAAKREVLNKALSATDTFEMPIRAFLQHTDINTNVYWAE
tara:strand:+ start:518 stop:1213 length:696 start_codon:yes stop_codon:yes gene_type:complete